MTTAIEPVVNAYIKAQRQRAIVRTDNNQESGITGAITGVDFLTAVRRPKSISPLLPHCHCRSESEDRPTRLLLRHEYYQQDGAAQILHRTARGHDH
jgi:hypothetical protein